MNLKYQEHMKHVTPFLTTLLAAVAFAACGDDTPDGKTGEDEDEIKLVAPTTLQVHDVTHNSVLVTWQGDTNALYHDVLVQGQDTLAVQSNASCGVDGLLPSTTYTWQVRARHGKVTTPWVPGPSFTTAAYHDVRGAWVGQWIANEWGGSVTLYGTEVPYEQFRDYMPGEVLDPGATGEMEITIELAEEEMIAMTFPVVATPVPAPVPVPEGRVLLPVIEGKVTVEETLSNTIPVVEEPVPVSEIPFLEAVGGTGMEQYLDGLVIETFTVNLTKLTFSFGPVAADTIPVTVTVDGNTSLKTNNVFADLLISTLDNKLKIKINSTLHRKEE
jgi:hypothetical protein